MKYLRKIRGVVLGNIVYSASQFLILITLIKFGTLNDVGIFTLVLSIVTPISVFFGFQLRNQLTINTDKLLKIEEVIITRNLLNLVFLIIGITFWVITNNVIFLIFTIYKLIESYYEIIYGIYLSNYDNDKMGRLLIKKSIGTFSLFVIVFLLTKNLNYAILSQIIYIIYLLFKNIKNSSVKIEFMNVKINKSIISFIISTLPLAISALLISITPQIPRYFLGAFGSVEDVGIFSSITYLVVIGTLFVNSINSSFSSTFSSYIQNGNYNHIKHLLAKNIFIFICIWSLINVTMFLFGEFIVKIIFNKTFLLYMQEIHIILLGSLFLFLSTLFINFTLYFRRYNLQLLIYGITLSISFVVGVFLVPKYNILGASLTLIISYFSQFIISILIFKYLMKDVKNERKTFS